MTVEINIHKTTMKRRKESSCADFCSVFSSSKCVVILILVFLFSVFIPGCQSQYGFEEEEDEYKGRLIGKDIYVCM